MMENRLCSSNTICTQKHAQGLDVKETHHWNQTYLIKKPWPIWPFPCRKTLEFCTKTSAGWVYQTDGSWGSNAILQLPCQVLLGCYGCRSNRCKDTGEAIVHEASNFKWLYFWSAEITKVCCQFPFTRGWNLNTGLPACLANILPTESQAYVKWPLERHFNILHSILENVFDNWCNQLMSLYSINYIF